MQRMSASFRTIVQCSSSATAVLDRDGVVVLANPAFATLVGVERDAVEGLFWPDLVIEEDSDAVVAVHRPCWMDHGRTERSKRCWWIAAVAGTRCA